MNVIFHDHRAITLDKIKPGQIAVEVRPFARAGERPIRVFAKIHAPNRTVDGVLLGENHDLIIELTDLQNQYLDKLNKDATGTVRAVRNRGIRGIQTNMTHPTLTAIVVTEI